MKGIGDVFRVAEAFRVFSQRNSFQDVVGSAMRFGAPLSDVLGQVGLMQQVAHSVSSPAVLAAQAGLMPQAGLMRTVGGVESLMGSLELFKASRALGQVSGGVSELVRLGQSGGVSELVRLGQIGGVSEMLGLGQSHGVSELVRLGQSGGVSELLGLGRASGVMQLVKGLASYPSLAEMGTVSRFGLAAVAAGFAGSASAKSALVHIATGTLGETPFGEVLAKLDEASEAVGEEGERGWFDGLFSSLFRGGGWARIPRDAQAVAAYGLLVALGSFALGVLSLFLQQQGGAEQTALLQQQLALLGGMYEEMASVREEYPMQHEPEVRAVRRLCPVYSGRSGRSSVQAKLEKGDLLVVIEVRRRWMRIVHADLVTGQPVLGWARKKCTKKRRGRRR